METILSEQKDFEKYMIFRLGEELYGSPLLRVREVAVYKEPKPVPNSAFGFEGVINLRGEVVGVVDLRKLLKVKGDAPLCMLVFESEMGPLAAIIDKVLSVIEISNKDIETRTASSAQENHDYFIGIGKVPLGLVTMIDLPKIANLIK